MPKIIPISYSRLECIFKKDGFVYSRVKGDHIIYVKPGVSRPLVIPKYNAVPVFVIKNLLRTADMSRERYLVLLNEC